MTEALCVGSIPSHASKTQFRSMVSMGLSRFAVLDLPSVLTPSGNKSKEIVGVQERATGRKSRPDPLAADPEGGTSFLERKRNLTDRG